MFSLLLCVVLLLLAALSRGQLSDPAAIFEYGAQPDAVCREIAAFYTSDYVSRLPRKNDKSEEGENDEADDSDVPDLVISVNASRCTKDQPLKVTVSSSVPFRGLVLQGRVAGGAIVGEFILPSSSMTTVKGGGGVSTTPVIQQSRFAPMRSLSCGSEKDIPRSQRSDTVVVWQANGIASHSFTWIMKSDLKADSIQFAATIFEDERTIRRNITSYNLNFDKDLISIDITGCGRTKGCFRYATQGMSICDWSTCQYMLTYHVSGTEAHFEMSGKAGWVAVGFSSDEKMGGDDVFMCVRSRSGVDVRHYVISLAHANPSLSDVNPFYNKEGFASGEDAYTTGSGSEGVITCRFSRPLKVMNDQLSVDLSTNWFQLYAWGSVSTSDTISRHTLDRPPTSKTKITLKTTRNEIMASSTARLITDNLIIWVLTSGSIIATLAPLCGRRCHQ